MKRLIALLVTAGFLAFVPTAPAAPVYQLSFQSQPGDFIGQGQSVTLTNADVSLFPPRALNRSGDAAGLVDFVEFVSTGLGTTFFTLDVGVNQVRDDLVPGFYLDAQRASFASVGHPGLDFTWDHRGSNTLTGNFTVFDALFDYSGSTPRIARFSVDFEQHSEGATPALFGRLTFSDVPEPSALALLVAGLAAMRRGVWKRGGVHGEASRPSSTGGRTFCRFYPLWGAKTTD